MITNPGSAARCRILFLAAEPGDQARHAPAPELRAIRQALQASPLRDQIDLQNRLGITFAELQCALLEYRPQVLHISSHGSAEGIYLVDEHDDVSEFLDHDVLATLLSILKDNLRLVIVNACSSTSYIDAIARAAPIAIGMPPELPTEAAVAFSTAFYRGLGDGRAVEESFRLGKLAVRHRTGLAEDRCPQLRRQDPDSELTDPRSQPVTETVLDLVEAGHDSPELSGSGFVEAVAGNPAPSRRSRLSRPQLAETVLAAVAPMRFIAVPGGEFMMGSPENEPDRKPDEAIHRVVVSEFQLAETPVTQEQWQFVMGHNPSLRKNGIGPQLPVQNVSWLDAIAFLDRLSRHRDLQPAYTIHGTDVVWNPESDGYRLPTEAEWEYACRANTRAAYSFGADPSDLEQFAWFGEGHDFNVHPVASKKANPWGFHDMHGNVWEWVWDRYGPYMTAGTQHDPRGPDHGDHRTLRGGSSRLDSKNLRCAKRFAWATRRPGTRALGLRVARSCPCGGAT